MVDFTDILRLNSSSCIPSFHFSSHDDTELDYDRSWGFGRVVRLELQRCSKEVPQILGAYHPRIDCPNILTPDTARIIRQILCLSWRQFCWCS
jgi:hypothetical protein